MFRVIDVEAADLDGGICEIAYVDSNGGWITDTFSALTNPGRPIGIDAMSVHHITDGMVSDCPAAPIVVDGVLKSDLIKVAHNADFEAKVTGWDRADWVCTLKMCRYFYPEPPKHTNQYMRYYLGLSVDTPEGLYPHRALYDCYVTEAILRRIISEFNPSVEDMIRISNQPSLITNMRFGKYKDQLITDVAKKDSSYLNWCMGNMTLDEDTIFSFKKALGL